MIDTTTGTTCADCGAAFPQPPASGVAGYAVTRVPRFPAPRVRTLNGGTNCGTTETRPPGASETFPALYDVERHNDAEELNRKLPPRRAPGETVDVVSVTIDGELAQTPERRICYACCAILESETMVATGRTCLYLVTRPAEQRLGTIDRTHVRQTMAGPYHYRYELSNWPGSAGFRLLGSVRESHGYGFGRRYPVRTFRFAGPDGFVWSGRSAGDMDLARCRRTKQRTRGAA